MTQQKIPSNDPRASTITVLRDRYVPSPEKEGAAIIKGHVQGVPLASALARVWPTDAHFCAYAPVTIHDRTVRLTVSALDPHEIEAIGGGARMVAMIGDLDDPVAHTEKTPARAEWRAEQLPRIQASGLASYETHGGYRVLATLADPMVLSSRADAARWTETYLGWCEYQEQTHGLVLDRSCSDWTRLFRLPNVNRQGVGKVKARVVGKIPACDPIEDWLPPPEGAAKARPANDGSAPVGQVDSDPTARAVELAEAIAPAYDAGGRQEGNAFQCTLGWLLGKGVRAGEIMAVVDALSEGASDRSKYLALAQRVKRLDGPNAAVKAWLGDGFDRVDEIANRWAREWEERRAKAKAKKPDPGAGPFHAAGQGEEPEPLLQHGRMVDRSCPPPPLVYVIEGLDLAQGKVSAVQAFANVAKTPFALLMAICVASGKPFLGHEVKQRNALFLAFEGGILTEEREARLCAGLGLERQSVPLHFMHVDSAIGEELLEAVCAYVEKHSIGIVVIDTYGSALPGDIEHNSDKFSFWLKKLGKLSDATGALVVVLLHENKSESAKGMRKMSGHNSAPGAIQAAIGLERTSDDRTLIDVYCSREVRKAFAPFRVQFKDVPCAEAPTGLSLVAEKRLMPSADADGKDTRPQNVKSQQDAEQKTRIAGARIWKLIREGNQRHTAAELKTIGGEGVRPGERALARLQSAGFVDYTGGKYARSQAGADATAAQVSAALAGLSRVMPEKFTKANEG